MLLAMYTETRVCCSICAQDTVLLVCYPASLVKRPNVSRDRSSVAVKNLDIFSDIISFNGNEKRSFERLGTA